MSDVIIDLGAAGFNLEAAAAEFQAAGWNATYGQDTSDPVYLPLVTDTEGNSKPAPLDMVSQVSQWLVLSGANRATVIMVELASEPGWYYLMRWLSPAALAQITGMGYSVNTRQWHPVRWTDHGDGTAHLKRLPVLLATTSDGEYNFQTGSASQTGTLIIDVEPSDVLRKVIITSAATGAAAAYDISAGMTGLVAGLEPGVYELTVKSGADYEYWRGQVEIVDDEVTRITALLEESITLIALTVNITPSPPLYEGH